MQSGNKEQLTSTVKQLYKYPVFQPKIPPIKVQWVLSPRQCTQKIKKKEKHTYKSNTLTISLKTQSTGKNSINFDVKNLTAPPQRTAYIFSYTYKCTYVCMCVWGWQKNKFPYHFLCKSFGKQTEMCIKLQQCNKLRDAKVQQKNGDWDGERWPERSAHCQISRVSTTTTNPPNPSPVQWYAKNCMSLRWQRYVDLPELDPYPRGPPGRLWTVAQRFFM